MYCVLEARKNCCCRRRQLRKVRLVVAGLSPVPRAKATAGARRRYKVQVFITSSVAVLSIPMYCLPRTHATYALQYVQSILSYFKKKKKKKYQTVPWTCIVSLSRIKPDRTILWESSQVTSPTNNAWTFFIFFISLLHSCQRQAESFRLKYTVYAAWL